MKVGFYERQLCERGTTVAIFDYAYFNEKILGNESVIFYLNNPPQEPNGEDVKKKFEKNFKIYGIDKSEDIDEIVKKEDIDILYQLSLGGNSHIHSKFCKNVIHCVLECNNVAKHFSKMATISKDVFEWKSDTPIVPHMINLPKHHDNMRKELNIPEDAVVFGRYGGETEFNISYVHHHVIVVAREHPEIFFLFVNTKNFLPDRLKDSYNNIIFLPRIPDEHPQYKKVKFINTCDAMLWGRQCGEAFGIAIGEFNIFNKPIICSLTRRHNAHIRILGEKGIYYPNCYGDKELDKQLPMPPKSLPEILINFNRNEVQKQDWNAYQKFTPEVVIKIFEDVFLK